MWKCNATLYKQTNKQTTKKSHTHSPENANNCFKAVNIIILSFFANLFAIRLGFKMFVVKYFFTML